MKINRVPMQMCYTLKREVLDVTVLLAKSTGTASSAEKEHTHTEKEVMKTHGDR